MTSGLVKERLEAIVAVAVIGPMKRQDVDVVIDTGFTGYLTLTSERIGALDLQRVGRSPESLPMERKSNLPRMRPRWSGTRRRSKSQ